MRDHEQVCAALVPPPIVIWLIQVPAVMRKCAYPSSRALADKGCVVRQAFLEDIEHQLKTNPEFTGIL